MADGLGDYSQPGRAALLAVYEAAAWLRDCGEHFGRGSFGRLFADVHAELRSYARELAGGGDPAPRLFGTTLLVAVDTGEEIVAAHAGDGAIWHIRGNLDGASAVNLLNPHSAPRGRHNIMDAASATAPVPTVVTVSKDAHFGDIFILCTDGNNSADRVEHGTRAQARITAIHQALRDLFAAWDGEAELPLRAALESCLAGLRRRGILDEDATLGVLITAEALRCHRRIKAGHGGEGRAPDLPRNGFARRGAETQKREHGART